MSDQCFHKLKRQNSINFFPQMRMRNGTRTRVGSGSQRATRTKFRIRSVPPRSRTGEREWKTGNLRSRSSERQTPHRRQTATAVLTMMRYPNGHCALVFSISYHGQKSQNYLSIELAKFPYTIDRHKFNHLATKLTTFAAFSRPLFCM